MPTGVRIFILILVFAAILFAVEGIMGWLRSSRSSAGAINKRLKMIAEGHEREEVLTRLRRNPTDGGTGFAILDKLRASLYRSLHSAGLPHTPARIMMLMAAAVSVIFIALLVLAATFGWHMQAGTLLLAFTFAFAVGFGIPMMVLNRMAEKRRKLMQEQFPVALDVFVRGLRAGHPISAALDLLTREMSDPIGSEFGIVVDEITYGADIRDALQGMADRWGLGDMHMFVVCLSVQHETGGNLAEILENLSKVIRERASMFMKVRALSSEGRMTAIMLTALPILAFVGLFIVNPPFYLDVASHPVFIIGFGGLILLYFIGFFTIRKMIDLKV